MLVKNLKSFCYLIFFCGMAARRRILVKIFGFKKKSCNCNYNCCTQDKEKLGIFFHCKNLSPLGNCLVYDKPEKKFFGCEYFPIDNFDLITYDCPLKKDLI